MIHLKSLTLAVMTGLPGCGKTAAIAQLRGLVDLTYIDTDACWREVFPQPKFTPEESHAVFAVLATNVARLLAEGKNIIAEGVFASHERIERLREIAYANGARFLLIGVECDAATAFARMKERQKAGGNGPVPESLWLNLRAKLEQWHDREKVTWIDSGKTTPEQSAQLILRLLAY
jgi:predicted kinase